MYTDLHHNNPVYFHMQRNWTDVYGLGRYLFNKVIEETRVLGREKLDRRCHGSLTIKALVYTEREDSGRYRRITYLWGTNLISYIRGSVFVGRKVLHGTWGIKWSGGCLHKELSKHMKMTIWPLYIKKERSLIERRWSRVL